jgi:hypothetical protein
VNDQLREALLETDSFVLSLDAIFATLSSMIVASYTVVNTL